MGWDNRSRRDDSVRVSWQHDREIIMNFVASSDGVLFHFTSAGKVTLGPCLAEIARGSRWAEDPNDDFPTDQRWSDAFEAMLCWLSNRFPMQYKNRLLSRLRDKRRTRDEAFAEIIAAYYIETVCSYRLKDWEPKLAQNSFDFSILILDATGPVEVFVEVKAPSWTGERAAEIKERIQRMQAAGQPSSAELRASLEQERNALNGINSQRKYSGELKAKSSDPRDDISRTLNKTCFGSDGKTHRLPIDHPTLLVVVDDLELGMHEPGGDFMVKRALYVTPSRPVYPRGLFFEERFNRLSALATMTKDYWPHEEDAPDRFFSLFPNFRALP
jgi:hypothetical protein